MSNPFSFPAFPNLTSNQSSPKTDNNKPNFPQFPNIINSNTSKIQSISTKKNDSSDNSAPNSFGIKFPTPINNNSSFPNFPSIPTPPTNQKPSISFPTIVNQPNNSSLPPISQFSKVSEPVSKGIELPSLGFNLPPRSNSPDERRNSFSIPQIPKIPTYSPSNDSLDSAKSINSQSSTSEIPLIPQLPSPNSNKNDIPKIPKLPTPNSSDNSLKNNPFSLPINNQNDENSNSRQRTMADELKELYGNSIDLPIHKKINKEEIKKDRSYSQIDSKPPNIDLSISKEKPIQQIQEEKIIEKPKNEIIYENPQNIDNILSESLGIQFLSLKSTKFLNKLNFLNLNNLEKYLPLKFQGKNEIILESTMKKWKENIILETSLPNDTEIINQIKNKFDINLLYNQMRSV